jgi:uncharacterized membrane protein YgcG
VAKIREVPHEFADEFLDHVGQEFRFDHAKGLAEWIKNSADAYTREELPDDEQIVLVDLQENRPKRDSVFRVIDFAGMSHADIVEAFKRWGDPRAAQRGNKRVKTLGGHGNGGKFYMRQSFEESRFVTFRGGCLNIFGFNKSKKYGFLEGFEDLPVSLEKALEIGEIDLCELPELAAQRLVASEGFTVVTGNKPNNFAGSSSAAKILKKLVDHPQARRLIARKQVFARISGGDWSKLRVREIPARPDFAEAVTVEAPAKIADPEGNEHIYRDERWPETYLRLWSSRESLRTSGVNRIDFLGEVGAIGSYEMHELGGTLSFPAQAEFIHGECFCPKLDDPDDDCVKNDRDKLVDNEKTRTLLAWVRAQVDVLAEAIAAADAKERQAADLSQSSAFNELLNQWKNKFMPSLLAQLFGGAGEGSGFGGAGDGAGGLGDGNGVHGGGGSSDTENEGGSEGGGGEEEKRGRRSPTVLLSSYDADPLDPLGREFTCSARHPAVYQRHGDLEQGIYWINTSRPLAERIMADYGAESTRWRDYLFQRYVEIILKESIRELERKEGTLSADDVDGLIDQLYTQIHDQAEDDLVGFLFDEKLKA